MMESIAQISSKQQQKNHFFEMNNQEIRLFFCLFKKNHLVAGV